MSMLKLVRLAVTASLAAVSFGLISGIQSPEEADASQPLIFPSPCTLSNTRFSLDANGLLSVTCGTISGVIDLNAIVSNQNGTLVLDHIGGYASTSNSCRVFTIGAAFIPTKPIILSCNVLQPNGSFARKSVFIGSIPSP
jgi:hypothetical protein